MSAGFPLPSWRLARRRAKLIGGGGRACVTPLLELEAEGWRCVCVGGESEGLREMDDEGWWCAGAGGGVGRRADDDIVGVGAADEVATIDRRVPPGPVGKGLRLVPLTGAELLEPSEPARTFTTLTSGGAVGGRSPVVLPLLCSIKACCCCLRFIMDLTCSIALGSSSGIVKPITTGEIPLSTEGRRTSVSMGSARVEPTRRFLLGLGESDVEGGLNVGSRGFWDGGGTDFGGGKESLSVSCLTSTVRGDLRPLREKR